MDEYFTFNDVLLKPKFSNIPSRSEVDISAVIFKKAFLRIPIISANMDTITGPDMCTAMNKNGGLGILHRFCSIEDNIKMLLETGLASDQVAVSIGISEGEKERAEALFAHGATMFCVDVAHGAQQSVVDQVKWLQGAFKDAIEIMVGNFATADAIREFIKRVGFTPSAFKVGIGPGSVCTTRTKTGVGVPQLSAIIDCVSTGVNIIADGGMKTPGDVAKALAAGAKAVMVGAMLAGTNETPDIVKVNKQEGRITTPDEVYYRGSASGNYGNGWKTSEGMEILVPYKGPVDLILKDIEGGLRSSLTYLGAADLQEFRRNAEFMRVSEASAKENKVHFYD